VLFVAGENEAVLTSARQAFDTFEEEMPNLRKKGLLLGDGHWIQPEHPTEVNGLLLALVAGLGP